MKAALDSLPQQPRDRLRRAPNPGSLRPMKAILTDRRFSEAAWIFERKLDGVRCLAARHHGEVRLTSRTGRRLDRSYPELRHPRYVGLRDDKPVREVVRERPS